MGNLIVTIGREFGSAGKNVGLSLSEHLNIPCYDKELLERAARKSLSIMMKSLQTAFYIHW